MIWKTLALLVALAAPALAASHEASAKPDLIVNVFSLASCKCIAQENINVTWASGLCTRQQNPFMQHECFVKTEVPHHPAPAEPNGYCHIEPTCPDSAAPCQFRGYQVTIKRRWCFANDCCSGGARVSLDGVAQGGLPAGGGMVGPIICDPGALACGKDVTKKIKVSCGGAIVFRVEASFVCNPCTVISEAQAVGVGN